MSTDDPIAAYMRDLSEQLPQHNRRASRVLAEVEDHLRTRAAKLISNGLTEDIASAEAIARLGSAANIVIGFHQHAPFENEVISMFRFLLTPLAALSCTYAAAHLTFGLWDDQPLAQYIVRIAVSMLVFAASGLTLVGLWRARPLALELACFAGGLALIALGTANAVWCAHLGLTTGDWEYYGFVGGALL